MVPPVTTLVTSLHLSLPAASAGAPEWVHLLPAGNFSGADGRGPYNVEDADALISASMAGGKLAIDENHSTDLAKGQSAPARGWIVELQKRDDGVWGRVEWTKAGAEMMGDKAYRGISPVFIHAKNSPRVLRLLRAALTNDPNLTLTALHHRSDDMDFLAKLRKALGLKDDAAEDAVLSAVTTAHAAITVAAEDRVKLAKAAGLKDDASVDAIVTALNTRSGDDKEVATLRTTVTDLQAQLMTLQKDGARDKAVAFIDGAITAGKPIKPLRDHYIERHVKDAAAVEKEVNGLVSIHAGAVIPTRDPNAKPTADSLDAEERRVVQLMGLDPAKFAETKAKINETMTRG